MLVNETLTYKQSRKLLIAQGYDLETIEQYRKKDIILMGRFQLAKLSELNDDNIDKIARIRKYASKNIMSDYHRLTINTGLGTLANCVEQVQDHDKQDRLIAKWKMIKSKIRTISELKALFGVTKDTSNSTYKEGLING